MLLNQRDMDRRKIIDSIRLAGAVLLSWMYVPHIVLFMIDRGGVILSDVKRLKSQLSLRTCGILTFIYEIHYNRYYRSLFYYRIGPVWSKLIGWWRPGDRYFQISQTTRIGKGVWIAHPFATILNAEKIGDNFSCIHCTTIGAKGKSRPVIGDNVSLGANVTIVGNVHIGNNVIVGAGSVVVKDVPSDCIVAGNPAKIISCLNQK